MVARFIRHGLQMTASPRDALRAAHTARCAQVAEEIGITHTIAYPHTGKDLEALDVLYRETEVNTLSHVSS